MGLQQLASPAIPIAPQEYTIGSENQTRNVYRLFFNRLATITNAVIGTYGGQYVDCPNGLFFDLTTQTLAAANTGYPVVFGTTYLNHGVTVTAPGKIYTAVNGVYNFQFSGQLKSTSSSGKQVWIWIVRNGVTIGYSTHQYTLVGSDNHMNVSWNFDIDMQAGQYLQLYWGADNTNVVLETVAATAPHPGIPSAVMTVNYVAPLPDPLPTPP